MLITLIYFVEDLWQEKAWVERKRVDQTEKKLRQLRQLDQLPQLLTRKRHLDQRRRKVHQDRKVKRNPANWKICKEEAKNGQLLSSRGRFVVGG